MYLVMLARLFVVMTIMLWSFSLLANLSGISPKVKFRPGLTFQSQLYSNIPFTASKSGSINYRIHEVFLGETLPPDAWHKRFAVKILQRDDGGHDIYRLITPSGERDGETLLEGSFSRNDDDHTAVLEYKDPADNTWVKIEFANTRTTFPETEDDKENWRLRVTTTITPSDRRRNRVLLKIEDELKWFDIVAL